MCILVKLAELVNELSETPSSQVYQVLFAQINERVLVLLLKPTLSEVTTAESKALFAQINPLNQTNLIHVWH